MISDKNIVHYVTGFIVVLPILILVVNHVLQSMGINHSWWYAILGTLIFLWIAAWIFSFVDDVMGHLDS